MARESVLLSTEKNPKGCRKVRKGGPVSGPFFTAAAFTLAPPPAARPSEAGDVASYPPVGGKKIEYAPFSLLLLCVLCG
jgi:hypothetical protein